MTPLPSSVRGPVYFCFANPAGFSGQKAATELVMGGLTRRGWLCRPLPQPVLERNSGSWFALPRYVGALLVAWLKCGGLLTARGGWLCVNLGQTRAAFLRDAVPLLLGSIGLGRDRVVVSLHGSLFMRWEETSTDARVFRFLLARAGVVTVLGDSQRQRLVALGLPPERIQVVVNSCDMEPPPAPAVTAKQHPALGPGQVVRCLYLSSLIDTKGYPEFLEALLHVSVRAGPRIEAVLCGRLVASEFSRRFPDADSARDWIERQIAAINVSARVRVRWVQGATGASKAALFHTADIFVLPTRYAVEAQPLVLLEAMACGCAIITTRVGEIPTILDEECAVFLPKAATEELVAALADLAANTATRGRLARAAHDRFRQLFQLERHLDRWETILRGSAALEGGAP